jgi:DNA-binding CsgD family transcriptional regulator
MKSNFMEKHINAKTTIDIMQATYHKTLASIKKDILSRVQAAIELIKSEKNITQTQTNSLQILKHVIIDVIKNNEKILHELIKLKPAKAQYEIPDAPSGYYINHNGKLISLTKREAECIQLLKQGLSAKQTAYTLQISVRTVESYLNNLKRKAHCHSKLALLAKIKNSDE